MSALKPASHSRPILERFFYSRMDSLTFLNAEILVNIDVISDIRLCETSLLPQEIIMADRITATVSRIRHVNIFQEFSHAHLVLLQNACEKKDGFVYEFMTCIIIGAFKFEAFLNHVGYRLMPFWSECERLTWQGKLSIIATHVGIEVDKGVRPYQTIKELFDMRNMLAHGKPATLIQEPKTECGTREELRRRRLLTKWEQQCTPDFAQRAYDDTEEMAELIWAAAKLNSDELKSQTTEYRIANAKLMPST